MDKKELENKQKQEKIEAKRPPTEIEAERAQEKRIKTGSMESTKKAAGGNEW